MDRREALKRLGVGGAIAAATPLVLDGFNVAHALSPGAVPTDQEVASATTHSIGGHANDDLFLSLNAASIGLVGGTFSWSTSTPLARVLNGTSTAPTIVWDGNGNMNNASFSIYLTYTDADGSNSFILSYNSGALSG